MSSDWFRIQLCGLLASPAPAHGAAGQSLSPLQDVAHPLHRDSHPEAGNMTHGHTALHCLIPCHRLRVVRMNL